jgi:hypothetical protein
MNSSDTLHLQLVRAASARNSLMRIIGEVGAEIKKDQKRFLKQHNMDSLKAYLAQPDVNIAESTFNTSVRLWNVYGPNGLDITEEQWVSIGPRKLGIIAPTVSETPELSGELLDVAEHLSVSDLLMEIRGEEKINKGRAIEAMGETSPTPLSLMSPAKYKKLVKESPCCVCGKEGETTYAHWPRTKNRGNFGLPLCGICHRIQEDTAKTDWFRDHFVNISRWLDKLIGGNNG